MARSAAVVVDLGFGDAGKGLVTDYVVRRLGASLVVRFNGGAQAGHNVTTADGRHHTFAQFGAGTFAGAHTWLGPAVLVHPSALMVEANRLRSVGVGDPLSGLTVHGAARIVTPFHQAVNRLRELARGDRRHGSCGVGIGETVRHAIEHATDAIRAQDLADRKRLRSKARRIQEQLRCDASRLPDAPGAELERRALDDPTIVDAWVQIVQPLAAAVGDDRALTARLRATRAVVFEGAQGILLDERYGFYPHTTWSKCVPTEAIELASANGFDVETIGVLRSHAVRHGAGPLPTETSAFRADVRDHNRTNPWQGAVRYGWFDAVLARYALDVAKAIDTVALTHLDLLLRFEPMKICVGYEGGNRLVATETPTLEDQARLGEWLMTVRPVLEPAASDPRAYVEHISRTLSARITLYSSGPTANDVVRLR